MCRYRPEPNLYSLAQDRRHLPHTQMEGARDVIL